MSFDDDNIIFHKVIQQKVGTISDETVGNRHIIYNPTV